MSKHSYRGLNGRHRYSNGEIRHKDGNTEIGILRRPNGDDLAASRSDMALRSQFDCSKCEFLSDYVGSGKLLAK